MRPRDKIIAAVVKKIVDEAKFIALMNGPTEWWPDHAVRVLDLIRQGVFQEINSYQQDLLRKANEK